MNKKILIPLIIIGMVFLVECKKDQSEIDQMSPSYTSDYKAGGNGGGGGGGHTEVAGNNLSFPAYLTDGYAVTDVTADVFAVIYSGTYEGLTPEQITYLQENGPWYPQKTLGNVWQADYSYEDAVDVDWIDWGDAIEAVNPKLRRPYRLELVLYAASDEPMEAFVMAELEYPSSKNELQGTNTITYDSYWASVASPMGNIVVQRFEGVDPSTLTWNADEGKWDGAEDPATGFGFAVENNVGGKLIFGASTGGWKPSELGAHRITFYLSNSSVTLSTALIGNYSAGTFIEVIEGETNTPVVDITNDLTYVDVTVEAGGGGGGGGH